MVTAPPPTPAGSPADGAENVPARHGTVGAEDLRARRDDAGDADLLAGTPSRAQLLRRARLPLAAVAILVLVAILTGAPADAALTVVHRLGAAQPAWVLGGIALEACSFAGYVVLLSHVAGRAAPRFGLADAYRTTVAGAAATRLLPTAGAGGAALTLWVLRRAGAREAGRTLMTFLVVLYGVFLLAVAAAGTTVALAGRPAVGALPAALAVIAMLAAVLLGRDAGQRTAPADTMPVRTESAMTMSVRTDIVERRLRARWHRAAGAGRTVGLGVHDAAGLLRAHDPRLLGALAWWGFDVAVLGAAVHAVGGSLPLGTLVLAYVLGQTANTVPLPGAASSGLAGVLVMLDLDPATAVAAVLVYRAVAVWLPAPAGLVALAGLRRSVAAWRAADAGVRPVSARPVRTEAHVPQPLAA